MRHPSQPRHRSGLWHFGDPDETSHPGGPLRRWLRFSTGVVYEIGREPDRQTDPWYKTVVIYWAQWPFGIVCLSIYIFSIFVCILRYWIVYSLCFLYSAPTQTLSLVTSHCCWLGGGFCMIVLLRKCRFIDCLVWSTDSFRWRFVWSVVYLFIYYIHFLLLFLKLLCASCEYLARLYNRQWLSIVQL